MDFLFYTDVSEQLNYTKEYHKDLTKFLEWISGKKICKINMNNEFKVLAHYDILNVSDDYKCRINNCVDYEHTHCICGHPIADVYLYKNIESNTKFFIGNKCIDRFRKDSGTEMTDKDFNKNFKGINSCCLCDSERALNKNKNQFYHIKCYNILNYNQRDELDLKLGIKKPVIKSVKIRPVHLTIIKFGKHINKTFQYLFDNDKSYVRWVLNKDDVNGQMKELKKWLENKI